MTASDTLDRWLKAKWPDGSACPKCGTDRPYSCTTWNSRRFRCRLQNCRHDFSLSSGIIFGHPKKPLEWYEGLIQGLIEGQSVFKISGSNLASYKGAWAAIQQIFSALPRADLCAHSHPPIKTPRPIVKITACAECGQICLWKNAQWSGLGAFVDLPILPENLFFKVLEFCLRPSRV